MNGRSSTEACAVTHVTRGCACWQFWQMASLLLPLKTEPLFTPHNEKAFFQTTFGEPGRPFVARFGANYTAIAAILGAPTGRVSATNTTACCYVATISNSAVRPSCTAFSYSVASPGS